MPTVILLASCFLAPNIITIFQFYKTTAIRSCKNDMFVLAITVCVFQKYHLVQTNVIYKIMVNKIWFSC